MSSRDFILDQVRRNQPAPVDLPELPAFNGAPADLLVAFAEALARMGGKLVVPAGNQTLDRFIAQRFGDARIVCSATPEVRGTRAIDSVKDARELQDVDVGVVRAAFGVAETGSVWLSEREFGINALGFLAQHLVVLLDPAAIVAGLAQAYCHPGFLRARYAVLMTGPSATADIEGVLVRGAQGIRSLTVIPVSASG